ncbi:MAG: divergent polysaccharide deacetylase family protein, partial [Alphaproteobacteria bacterium]|nr:divergent polysaccharide deacetylase family protein [Alphaproteobacteria bacterium]
TPMTAGRPMVVVVIDDLGLDRRRSERILALPGPLTTAFLPYARDLGAQTQAARARGHELLVHVPMEPQDEAEDPGPEALRAAAGPEAIRLRLGQGLSRFGGFIGINNHMGSRFTSDLAAMRVLMSVLKEHGLMFLDSVTSDRTVGRMAAREAGVPFVARDVFLDDKNDAEAVARQLDRLEESARRNGAAVAICHPRDITIDALARWLPTLEAKGLVLVPLSAVARRNGGA